MDDNNQPKQPSKAETLFRLAARRGFKLSPIPCPVSDRELLDNFVGKSNHVFRQIAKEISTFDETDSLPHQYHKVKRDYAKMPEDYEAPRFSEKMRNDYHAYKQLSERNDVNKAAFLKADKAYNASYERRTKSWVGVTLKEAEKLRYNYWISAKKLFKSALQSGQARFDFLEKYPGAFNYEKTEGHIGYAIKELKDAMRACKAIIDHNYHQGSLEHLLETIDFGASSAGTGGGGV
ncbi:hypothetical protein F5Y10DRAFT_267041 [Nemania abortiva]|nr:hypothetical protein F5Y10DRAFT_267041 [Nemania abortiva]